MIPDHMEQVEQDQGLDPEQEPAEAQEPESVEDETEQDSEDFIPLYSMLSYGADLDIAGVVGRLERADIEVPTFQRDFVWTFRQAARFIESLLLGLPVPGVFFWTDPETQRLVVVDGQQRLKTLQYFYRGVIRGREFKLPQRTSPYQTVHPAFQGKTYRTLEEEQRRRLDNTILHATIVQQERPEEDDSSIFYLFERLNTEGTPLQPQEIRSAVYRGNISSLLSDLNQHDIWRDIYGAPSPRMKDRELILRFFALSEAVFIEDAKKGDLPTNAYARPMKEFLNRFMSRNRQLSPERMMELSDHFTRSIQSVFSALGNRAFRPAKTLNAAVFDAIMIGVNRRLDRGPITDFQRLRETYEELLASPDFRLAYTRATADADSVNRRLTLATQAFAAVP